MVMVQTKGHIPLARSSTRSHRPQTLCGVTGGGLLEVRLLRWEVFSRVRYHEFALGDNVGSLEYPSGTLTLICTQPVTDEYTCGW